MTRARHILLWAEMGALYVMVPLFLYGAIQYAHISLLLIIALIFAAIMLALSLDRGFSWCGLLSVEIGKRQYAQILGLFVLLGGALTVFTAYWLPEQFLAFPRQRPGLWLAVLVLYPLVSVSAQEIMFRVFFLHRYGVLFEGKLPIAILVNAALFSFAHIVFMSWVTVVISFAGGLIFACRYVTTRSFRAVVLEHSLYGNLIFTVGLGHYFLAGAPFA